MKFGKHSQTTILQDGSSVTRTVNYADGVPKGSTKDYYEMRSRVDSALEEAAIYHNFTKQLHDDPTMLDPAFRIEGLEHFERNNYYYVVKCYTKISD